ncbi:alpha/beta hydrolase family protein [Rheinheimera sp.]|uniref:alpha/beta hydrolase family protein n=1 Tax=Rheinheimera sp. TaxID=1869214 RepID=UPI003AF8E6C5
MKAYILAFLLAGSLFMPPVWAKNNEPDLVTLLSQHSNYTDVKISPDGKHLAAVIRSEGRRSLVFIALDGFQMTGSVRFPGLVEVGTYHWVNNERVVIELAESVLWNTEPRIFGEIYAVNYDGKKSEMLFGYRAGEQQVGTRFKAKEGRRAWGRVVDTLEQDNDHILITATNWNAGGDGMAEILKINVYSGKTKRLAAAPAPYSSIITNDKGEPRLAVVTTKTAGQDVYLRDQDKWNKLPADWFGEGVNVVAVSPSDDSLLFVDQKDTAMPALSRMDFSGKRTVVFSDAKVGITDVELTKKDKQPYALRLDDGNPAYVLLDKTMAESQLFKNLITAFPGEVVSVTSRSSDDMAWVIYTYSDVNPGAYFLYQKKDNSLRKLMDRKSELNGLPWSETTAVNYPSFDQLPVQGYLTKAKGQSKALVVLIHGGPHGVRDYWGFNEEVQLLSQSGYNVLQVNFRGSGGYGDAFQRAGYGQWGDAVQKDISAGVRYLIAQGVVDANQVCIMGTSFGGYSAVQSAAIEPDLYRCAIGVAGVYELEQLKSDGDIPLLSFGVAYLDQVLGTDKAQLKSYSPVYRAGSIKAPLLIIHGKRDRRAPYSQAEALRAALDKQGKTYQWLDFDDESHGFYAPENRAKYFDSVLSFLQQHLKP